MEFLFFILGIIIIGMVFSAIGEGIAEAQVGDKNDKNSKKFNNIQLIVSLSLMGATFIIGIINFSFLIWCSLIGLAIMGIGMCISRRN